MKFTKSFTSILFTILSSTIIFGQETIPTNYFGNANTITFDKITYNLAWSSHPVENYYKHEYLKQGDTIEKFNKLIIVEALTGTIKLTDIISIKIAELKKMKETNPVVNYEIFENDEEVMLDFIVSANTPDGKYLSIVERNVYRYKSIKEKNGQDCVLLFAVSERAYGSNIDAYFENLKDHRYELINLVGQFEMPTIALEK